MKNKKCIYWSSMYEGHPGVCEEKRGLVCDGIEKPDNCPLEEIFRRGDIVKQKITDMRGKVLGTNCVYDGSNKNVHVEWSENSHGNYRPYELVKVHER